MSDEDEDWFEKAVREMEGEAEEREEGEAEEREEGEAEKAEGVGEPEERAETEPAEGAGAEKEEAEAEEAEAEEREPEAPEETEPEPEEAVEPEEFGGEGEDREESPFEQDFATALENAPEPDLGEETPDFGGGGFAEGESGGFGSEGEDFGFGDFGESEGFEAEEEEFESELDRIDVGIEGLDEMILGGVPKRSLIVAIGSAGTGKTTFALQFLYQALSQGERAVYLTLEESREAILSTAEEKGWEFPEYVQNGQLAVIHLDPIEMANSLASIRSDLPRLVNEFGADRLVLDSVSLLEMMYDHSSTRRTEVFEFSRSLKEAGVTTLVTSEASPDNPYNSRYGIIEYLSDAVFILQYVRPSDFRETRLAVEIQKIRDANHSRETKPYEITDEGISVYRQANIF